LEQALVRLRRLFHRRRLLEQQRRLVRLVRVQQLQEQ
jgi:hypothetical protein